MTTAPLFKPESVKPVHAPIALAGNYTLRDYQREDADEVCDKWESGVNSVLVRWATGTGKSVLIAELARRMATRGRVLILVDVGTLAMDLVKSIREHTGKPPGVLTGDLKAHWFDSRVVVSTVQSMYAKTKRGHRYEDFDPSEFAAVIVDEAEASLADRYSEVVLHFVDGSPDCKLAGCTATPFRMDGIGMREMFEHSTYQNGGAPGLLNRDILWGYKNGWLVKPTQGFVSCELDFSSLKVVGKEDEADYRDSDIAKLMLDQDETQAREFAESIHHAAESEPSIMICPKIDVAKMVMGHLCGAARDNDIADVVHGKIDSDKCADIIEAFKRGEIPYLVSVNKLFKGFDADIVQNVFLLRKTRSRRLYEQSLGRGTRPLQGIRNDMQHADNEEQRMAIISGSNKPKMTMWDLVGIDANVKDLSVLDIIGDSVNVNIRERAKMNMMKRAREEAEKGEPSEREIMDVGDEAREAKTQLKDEAEEAERRRRAAISMRSRVSVERSDSMQAGFGSDANASRSHRRGGATDKQVKLLVAFGVVPETALGFGIRQAGSVIESYKKREAKPNWKLVNKWERSKR